MKIHLVSMQLKSLFVIMCVVAMCAGCGGGSGGQGWNITSVDQQVPENTDTLDDSDTSIPSSSREGCGDNTVSTGEVCDDGNVDNGDGCSSLCMIEFRDFGWSRWLGRTAAQETEEEDAFGNIMETTFISIDAVSYSPISSAGSAATVTATLTLDDEEEEASIALVLLVYSVNGGVEKTVQMTGVGGGKWTGSIPAQSSGAVVDFYIWAGDTNGNVTTGAISDMYNLVPGVPDMDNSEYIVGDNADLLSIAVNYDDDWVYVAYEVEGVIDGGTIDPTYIQMYGVKITNSDTEQGEGLMVGKLWNYMPLSKNEEVQDKLLPMLYEQGQEYIEQIGEENIEYMKETGMMVLDIQKLMAGYTTDGMLFDAEPSGAESEGVFYGKIKREPLGDNPSGKMRLLFLTAANASLDSFMPIPLNCTNFLTIYFTNYRMQFN